MSNTSYIMNQKVNNLRSIIDNIDTTGHFENGINVPKVGTEFLDVNNETTTSNIGVLSNFDLQSTNSIINCYSVSSNGFVGEKITELQSIFVNNGIADGEGSTYLWGQRITPLIPTYPNSWGLTLNNICLNSSINGYIAIRLIPTSNACSMSYIRREMYTLNNPIQISNSGLICLNSIRFKANSSICVKIEGVRLLNDTINTTYGKTKLNIRVWGTDMENTEVYNEIFAYLDDEIDNVNTDYSVEIFSMAQFSCTGHAWLYENGFF
jgi:hypothetical protein